MNSYEVVCIRRAGASTPVRSVTFVVDADNEDDAAVTADDCLARMRDFSDPELDIDTVFEVTVS